MNSGVMFHKSRKYRIMGESDMSKHKVRKHGYLSNVIYAVHKLWNVQDMISLRNIRKGYLSYFFAFPMAMIFVNIQNVILDEGMDIFGLSYTTITFIAFALGSFLMFLFSSEKNITRISKVCSIITAIGFVPWIFLPDSYISLIFDVVFMVGVGGCVSTSSFSFVFLLNNAERFFGSALMILSIGIVKLSAATIHESPLVRKALAFIIIATLCVCMCSVRNDVYHGRGSKKTKKFDPSIWIVLFLFLSYFAIRISGFYASAFEHPSNSKMWGILALILILCCIIQQVVLKRSIWTMCNLFFLTSIMSYLMWYVKLPQVAYMFSEIKEIGILIACYLIGCVTNKFCDFRMHKRLILFCMATIGFLYVGIDILHRSMDTQTLAAMTAAILFVVFLMLSPAFSQYLFFTDWSKEFRQINMVSLDEIVSTSLEDNKQAIRIENTNLSPREQQVVHLLLRGMTLRQIAPELGLTASTVATYSKTIYKKLGINSRAELFLLFGGPQNAKEDTLDVKI